MTSQTRRDWLVNIGQGAVAIGMAGQALARHTAALALPPGLFGPSSDHLSHALMSAEQYHSIPPDCPTDYVLPRSGKFEPQFFTASEFQVVRRLTELLLGDAPPGLSQEVAEWIDLRVASARGIREAELRLQPLHRSLADAYYGASHRQDAETQYPATILGAGLASLPVDFLSLEAARQLAILSSLSDEHRNPQSQNVGTKLFDYLKSEVINGFYTSKAGLKELDFKGNAFYARSPGCQSKS